MFDAGIISLPELMLVQPLARVERADVDPPDAALVDRSTEDACPGPREVRGRRREASATASARGWCGAQLPAATQRRSRAHERASGVELFHVLECFDDRVDDRRVDFGGARRSGSRARRRRPWFARMTCSSLPSSYLNATVSSGLSSPVFAVVSTNPVARAPVAAEISASIFAASTSRAAGAVCFHFSSSLPSLSLTFVFSKTLVWSL